jgi:hypothetical protein
MNQPPAIPQSNKNLTPCKDCGQPISKRAEKCPHCGVTIKKKSSGCAIIFAAFFLILVVGILVSSVMRTNITPEPETKEQREQKQHEEDASSAFYTAEEFVKKQLKAPLTAKFSSRYDEESGSTKSKTYTNDVWKAWGYVDSQNSFGAMMRSKWHVAMEKKPGDKWTILFSNIGDQTIGDKEFYNSK